jgi:hypothetical protein
MTMQHAEFRRLFGANPKRREPELLAHRASCPDCAKYAADLERVDGLLAVALEVPPPAAARAPWEIAPAEPRATAWRWYAMAASVLFAIGVAMAVWLDARRDTLFAELLKHANGERNVMVVSGERVSEDTVRVTLAKAGAHLPHAIPVSTARTCKVRGVVAPHLFVQTPAGPVQILVLREHRFLMRHSTSDRGLHAELVPVGSRSVAVFADSEAAVAKGRDIARELVWTPDPS